MMYSFEDFIKEWKNDADYIEAHTSGSTGEPKCIRLSKSFVADSARRTICYFSISAESHIHSCVAPDFIGGKMMGVRAVLADCRLTWEIPSNRPLGAFSPHDELDLVAIVPSQMLHILDHTDEMPKVRAYIIGGSPINAALRGRIERSGLNAYETYGMTETASHIALRHIVTGNEWFSTLDGISVSLDKRGCLVIEYAGGERFVTNDLATLQSPHSFRIEGRYDHVIITGGKKLNPVQVERSLSSLIEGEFMITSVPDEKWGNRVVLLMERSDDIEDYDEGVMLSKMREVLPPWQMPKEIRIVESLPRTPNGKLKR